MRMIYKYALQPPGATARLSMPRRAKVLRVDVQDSTTGAQMWCEVDTDAPLETREFRLYSTGSQIEGVHVGSFSSDGWHQWHVYDVTPGMQGAYTIRQILQP